MNTNKKQEFKELIQSNIDQYGYHVTIVTSAIEPRYAYSIGLTEIFNFELVFAGGIYFLKEDLFQVINEVVKKLKVSNDRETERIPVGALGTFSLLRVDSSWSKLMLLGAFDYYKTSNIRAFQIIPDSNHYTLDIPNMSKEFDASSEPVWQWLVRKWDYGVPDNSTVVTNINALLGEAITEVMRCEVNEWEMFAGAGPEVENKDMRVVSLGTILGIDGTILPAINLEIDKGLWRESADSDWNNWG
jgi:hypothetical protein